jgi:hypothetical protein
MLKAKFIDKRWGNVLTPLNEGEWVPDKVPIETLAPKGAIFVIIRAGGGPKSKAGTSTESQGVSGGWWIVVQYL